MISAFGRMSAATGALLAACVACCAPLLIPPAVALVTAGGVGLALLGQIGLAVLAAAGAAGLVLWHRRSAVKKTDCRCGTGGNCGEEKDGGTTPPRRASRLSENAN